MVLHLAYVPLILADVSIGRLNANKIGAKRVKGCEIRPVGNESMAQII